MKKQYLDASGLVTVLEAIGNDNETRDASIADIDEKVERLIDSSVLYWGTME